MRPDSNTVNNKIVNPQNQQESIHASNSHEQTARKHEMMAPNATPSATPNEVKDEDSNKAIVDSFPSNAVNGVTNTVNYKDYNTTIVKRLQSNTVNGVRLDSNAAKNSNIANDTNAVIDDNTYVDHWLRNEVCDLASGEKTTNLKINTQRNGLDCEETSNTASGEDVALGGTLGIGHGLTASLNNNIPNTQEQRVQLPRYEDHDHNSALTRDGDHQNKKSKNNNPKIEEGNINHKFATKDPNRLVINL